MNEVDFRESTELVWALFQTFFSIRKENVLPTRDLHFNFEELCIKFYFWKKFN